MIIYSLDEIASVIDRIIREKYCERLTLQILAKMAATNLHYVNLAFRQKYGITAFQLIRELRIEKAKALLVAEPDLTLEMIAILTQFHDGTRLIKVFKKKYGMTPDKYRKLIQS